MIKRALVVGLGNPGSKYQWTRHNIGWIAVEAFARELGAVFKTSLATEGKLAKAVWNEQEIYLLLPTTYMNLSGHSVRAAVRRFSLEIADLLVVSDDIYLPFGKLRFRDKGSSGGHNGLKSIEECLGTQDYARLRIGVGENGSQELASYVVSSFSDQEKQELPQIAGNTVGEIKKWLSGANMN